jgi:hypothetical protein
VAAGCNSAAESRNLHLQFQEKRLQNSVLQSAILIFADEKGGFAVAEAGLAVT